MIRPGELTAAYFRGQRVRYTQPVQLYLIAAAIFFLASSYRPFLVITESNDIVSALSSVAFGESLDEDRLDELAAAGGRHGRIPWTRFAPVSSDR